MADLAHYLDSFRGSAWSAWRDEGFQDTACKMLCGLNVHKGKAPPAPIPSKSTAATGSSSDSSSFPLEGVAVSPAVALRRLGMTVVGLTSRWEDTKTVLGFWFPWISLPPHGAKDDVRANAGYGASVETPLTLHATHRGAISAANQCDIALYKAAVAQFDQQLMVVKSSSAA